MKQSMNRWRIAIGVGTLVFAGLGLVWAAPAKKKPGMMKVKIDLLIPRHGMKATKTGVDGADHKVRIDVSVRATAAASAGVCSGPFKVKVESTEDPTTGRWDLVGAAGVAQLCVDPSSVKAPTVDRFFNSTVPEGEFRKFRATVDYLNQVDEADEGNNVDSVGYVAD